jgi:hypothetical protein
MVISDEKLEAWPFVLQLKAQNAGNLFLIFPRT